MERLLCPGVMMAHRHPRSCVSAAARTDGGPAVRREGERVADFKEPCISWRHSTACDSSSCVQVAVVDGSVLIRDPANPGEVVLNLPPAAWSAFLVRARRGDFGPRET